MYPNPTNPVGVHVPYAQYVRHTFCRILSNRPPSAIWKRNGKSLVDGGGLFDSILQNVWRTYCAYGTCTPTGFVGLGYIWMIGHNNAISLFY